MLSLAAAIGLAGTACSSRGSNNPGGPPSGLASILPTGLPTLTLHNDKFPCNLATQPEITALTGTRVAYDEIEPDGQTCVYILGEAGPTHVDIAVLEGEDRTQWQALNQDFPAWTTGADMGGKAVPGLGDEAFVSETPGYAGQLDIWTGTKLVRITVDVAHRLTDADVDKLTALGNTVLGRLP
jgi:hypothetical protein